jgi:hypothetical protein
MSLTLTPLQSDSFQRANVSPLAAPWALDEDNDFAFQILSDVCVPQAPNDECAQFFTYAGGTPNDQYCSATLAAALGASSFLMIKIRTTDNGGQWVGLPGYRLYVTSAGGWHVYQDNGTQTSLLNGSGLTISAGDVYTLAAVGTTIYAYQNGNLLGSVVDTTHASGQVMLGGEAVSSTSGLQISNFVMGSAAVASGSSSLPFLGSVYEGSAPSNIPNPVFLGTVKVIASAPNGAALGSATNPYLGTVAVVVGPTGSQNNPTLGEVVSLGSKPSSIPDRFLGNVATE